MMPDLEPEQQEAFRALCAAEGLRVVFSREHDSYQVVRVEGLKTPGSEGPVRKALAEEAAMTDTVEFGVPTGFAGFVKRLNTLKPAMV
jgi:hypothetical protein